MARIRLFVMVDGAASMEEAQELAMSLLLATKLQKSKLEQDGHTVVAKAAIPCEVCGGMVDVRHRGLCPTCGMDLAVDRQLAETVTIPMQQPAEALF